MRWELHNQDNAFWCSNNPHTFHDVLLYDLNIGAVCSEWVQNRSFMFFKETINYSPIYGLDLQISIQTVTIWWKDTEFVWKSTFFATVDRQYSTTDGQYLKELHYVLRSNVTRCKATSEPGAQNFGTRVLNKVIWTAAEIWTIKCQRRQPLYVAQLLCWDQRLKKHSVSRIWFCTVL